MKQQESAEKPPCFHSEREYEQWKDLLMRSREKGVTICDDCTKEYETRMKADGRCKPVQAKRWRAAALALYACQQREE